MRLGKIADKSAKKPDIAATANDKDGISRVPQAQPKDKPRDGGNPGGTTMSMPKPDKVSQAPTPVQSGGDKGEYNVAIDTVKKNAGLTDYTKRYNTLPDGSIVKNPEFTPAATKPSDLNKKPNTGPKYNTIDKPASAKTKPSDAELAAQYAKNTNPKLNVKPVATPSAKSADKAIAKSGDSAINSIGNAISKDYNRSYTKKGVDSLYKTITGLFK